MIGWIVLIVAIALIWLFFKMRHARHKFYAIVLILLLVFLSVTGYKVIKDSKININSVSGSISAVNLYFIWLGGLFSNTRTIVGNVVKLNFGGNSTSTG